MITTLTKPDGDYLLRIGPGVPADAVSPTPAPLPQRRVLAGAVSTLVASAAVVALLAVVTTIPAWVL